MFYYPGDIYSHLTRHIHIPTSSAFYTDITFCKNDRQPTVFQGIYSNIYNKAWRRDYSQNVKY